MNISIVKTMLKKVPLFKELTSSELDEIVNISQTRAFENGFHVFMQEDPLNCVYFIYSGKIKIYKNDINGKEQIVSILQSDEMFPHVGFFRKGHYPASALVVEDAKLVVISIAHFEKLLLKHPEVCMKLFRVMGEKIIDLQNRLEEQILNNTYEQIVKLLLRLSKTHGQPIDSSKTILSSHFTNKELANMIGTTRETVSRTITKLKKNRLIETNDKGRFILNVDLLEEELQ